MVIKDSKSKEPINSKMFCNHLNTILGASVNYLRNVYISTFLENDKKKVDRDAYYGPPAKVLQETFYVVLALHSTDRAGFFLGVPSVSVQWSDEEALM